MDQSHYSARHSLGDAKTKWIDFEIKHPKIYLVAGFKLNSNLKLTPMC